MKIKGKRWIKAFFILFIGSALYFGHKDFIHKIPKKIKEFIPISEEASHELTQNDKTKDSENIDSEMSNLKFSSENTNSIVGNVVAEILNKILSNPKGQLVIKEILQKTMRQASEIAGKDLLFSRYLTHDILEGKGEKAMCGDTVEILYLIKKKKTEENKEKEKLKKTIVIGDGTIDFNLEAGIVNMKEGGDRNIGYPKTLEPEDLEQQNSNMLGASVQLLSVQKKGSIAGTLGTPFFNKIEEKYTSSLRLICGDTVSGSYSLSNLKEKVLYDSQKTGKTLSFKIGESKIPAELSNAIMGLPAAAATVSFVTLPPNIQDSFSKIENFIPNNLFVNGIADPVILTFKLSVKK